MEQQMHQDPQTSRQQETKLQMSMKMILIVGGSSLVLLFVGFFLFFNLSNTEDAIAKAAIASVGNGNWNNTATWSTGIVPAASDDVTIDEGHTVTIPANIAADAKDFTVDGTLIANGDFTISGNMNINSGGSVDAPSNANKIFNITGDFNNDGTFNERNSTIIFNGNKAQEIAGDNSVTFNKLTINNTSITGVTLNRNVTVTNTLTLTDGLLYTTSSNLLTMDGASQSGGSADSYISGPQTTKTDGTNDVVFGTGKNGKYKQVTLTPTSNSATEFSVEFIDAAYSNTTSLAAGLNNVSTVEYFQIDRVSGTADAKVKLTWETDIGVEELSSIVAVGWDADATEWVSFGQSASSGNSSSGSVTSNTVTSFGPFTIGSTNSNNTLPIELLSFDGKVNLSAVTLSWTTATEINNDYFTLSRSSNGVDFEELTEIEGAGNSSVKLSYDYDDENPLRGVSYYKLKQTDYDGQFEEFPIISITFSGSKGTFNVYPNPITKGNSLNINYKNDNTNSENIDIEVYDLSGKLVYSNSLEKDDSEFNSSLNFTEDLSPGNYIINIKTESDNHSQQLVVK